MSLQRAMTPLALAVASFMVTSLAATAAAQSIKPIQYQGISLGAVAGDLYYTVRPDGYHVVATFAQRGQQATPVRFQAILAAGQSVTFSTPREAGLPPDAVEVTRQNDRLYIRKSTLTD